VNTFATGAALRRRGEILRVIRVEPVHSQEELQQRLASRGFVVAQPTLSRDLKDLGLAKTASGYIEPGEAHAVIRGAGTREKKEERLDRVLREFGLSVETAGTLVVLKTPPAAAHTVARAVDEVGVEGVVGTVAGDDTIFLATDSRAAATRVAARLAAPLEKASRPRRRWRA